MSLLNDGLGNNKIPRGRFLEKTQSLTTKGLDALRDILRLALLEFCGAGTVLISHDQNHKLMERGMTLTLP
jgi:hypothetical protein